MLGQIGFDVLQICINLSLLWQLYNLNKATNDRFEAVAKYIEKGVR